MQLGWPLGIVLGGDLWAEIASHAMALLKRSGLRSGTVVFFLRMSPITVNMSLPFTF